jgi:CRP/FNR family transcriptional regulator, anaerobic regulatory protein
MNIPVRIYDELATGQRKLSTIFGSSAPRTLKAGEIAGTVSGWDDGIYNLRAGWACRFRDFANGRRAIVEVYLPGDVIGLGMLVRTGPLKNILMLNSVTIEPILGKDALLELMADRPTALYLTWLLGQRQRRVDRLLAAISCLDARGRIAMMVFDFYTRLRRRRLVTGSIYNLPLTQTQIGQYLGLTVVHINRVLRSLREERIVNFEKHCVTILDLDRLTKLAQNGEVVSPVSGVGDAPQSNPPPPSVKLPAYVQKQFDVAKAAAAPCLQPQQQHTLSDLRGNIQASSTEPDA